MPDELVPPESVSSINQEECVLGILRQVQSGTKTFSGFHQACLSYKNYMKVKSWIMGIVRAKGNKLTVDEMKRASDAEVIEAYPSTFDETFIENLLPGTANRPAASGATPEIQRAVQQWMRHDEAVNIQVPISHFEIHSSYIYTFEEFFWFLKSHVCLCSVSPQEKDTVTLGAVAARFYHCNGSFVL